MTVGKRGKMKEITMKLEGMSCPSCMTKIQKAVEAQPGVSQVRVLFNAGKVKARVDDQQSSADNLASVVKNLGYTVEKISLKEA